MVMVMVMVMVVVVIVIVIIIIIILSSGDLQNPSNHSEYYTAPRARLVVPPICNQS